MNEFNICIMKENVQRLLISHSMTQQDLAAVTGMSQGNVSRALNPENSRCFTVEQIFLISKYFGVSIDELLGNA